VPRPGWPQATYILHFRAFSVFVESL